LQLFSSLCAQKGVMSFTEAVINDPRVSVRIVITNPPAPVSSHQGLGFRSIKRALARAMPEVLVSPALMIGGTDTHHYLHLVKDTLRFNPTRMTPQTVGMFHGVDERISIANYVEMIGFYRGVITLSQEDELDDTKA
jgi:carboxypeptidase PM20D1